MADDETRNPYAEISGSWGAQVPDTPYQLVTSDFGIPVYVFRTMGECLETYLSLGRPDHYAVYDRKRGQWVYDRWGWRPSKGS